MNTNGVPKQWNQNGNSISPNLEDAKIYYDITLESYAENALENSEVTSVSCDSHDW